MEKDIEAYLVRKIKERGGVAYKFTSPAHRGVADRVVCLNGHVCCTGKPASLGNDPAFAALFGARGAASVAVYRHSHDHEHAVCADPAHDHSPQGHSPHGHRHG